MVFVWEVVVVVGGNVVVVAMVVELVVTTGLVLLGARVDPVVELQAASRRPTQTIPTSVLSLVRFASIANRRTVAYEPPHGGAAANTF